jgi:TolB-like protein
MKIEALPSVFFATLVIALRIWLAAIFLTVLSVPAITHAKSKPRVAVVYFDNNSGDAKLDSLSKGFADMLITDLSSSKQVIVVEREKLQALIDESNLQQSKFFDPTTAVTIGKGLGASHVVAGAFMAASPKMRVDVRLIEIASGDVVLTAKVQGKSDDVFELEQELASKFLKKLNVDFVPGALPRTKVPDLKTLVAFSEGLGLADRGLHTQAAAQLKSVVQMAPTFALARLRHSEILSRLKASKTQRGQVLDRGVKTLYAHARSHLASAGSGTTSELEGSHVLGYLAILRHQASIALHATLSGRSETTRVIPTKGQGKSRRAMQNYYDIQRRIVDLHIDLRKKFPKASIRSSLSDDDAALASELGVKYGIGDSAHAMLRFLFEGRVDGSGGLKSYRMSPTPSDLDLKLKKAALKLSSRVIKNGVHLPAYMTTNSVVRAHNLVAEWHITRERLEKGITEYQKILDTFPTLKRWDYYERQIHLQLGLKHDHMAGIRRDYHQALKTCSARKINATQTHMLTSRMHSRGIQALPEMLSEVTKACRKSPDFDRIEKSLVRTLASRAGSNDDCDLLDKFEARWIVLGGSERSAKSYRKRYICN